MQVPPQSTPSSIPLCTPSLQDARAPGRKMHAVPRRRKRGSHWVQASPLYPAAHWQYPDVLPTHTPWPAQGCRPSQQRTHTTKKILGTAATRVTRVTGVLSRVTKLGTHHHRPLADSPRHPQPDTEQPTGDSPAGILHPARWRCRWSRRSPRPPRTPRSHTLHTQGQEGQRSYTDTQLDLVSPTPCALDHISLTHTACRPSCSLVIQAADSWLPPHLHSAPPSRPWTSPAQAWTQQCRHPICPGLSSLGQP